jgi:hypothetical protein
MKLAMMLWQLEFKKGRSSVTNNNVAYLAKICKSLSIDPDSELFELVNELLPEESRPIFGFALGKSNEIESTSASTL